MATVAPVPLPSKAGARSGKKFEIPDIYVILGAMILLVALLSYIIPAGEYQREIINGRATVVAGSFSFIAQNPVGFMQVIEAVPTGLVKAGDVVILTLLVGGAVGVIRNAGIINYGIDKLLGALGSRTSLMIPVLTSVGGVISAFIGTPELGIAYLPIVLPLMLRLGYDTMTATAIALLGPSIGFAFALTAPATVGTSHLLGQLPMFSGAGFRLVFLALALSVTIAFIMRHAARVKARPELSPTPELDASLREKFSLESAGQPAEYSAGQRLAGVATLLMFVTIIVSILQFKLGFMAISGLFMGMAVVACLVAGQRLNDICASYNDAMRGVMVGALICGIARGVSVVLEQGMIMDTIVFWLSELLNKLPSSVTAYGIFATEWFFNLIVPSGSGKAVITLPILYPLADLVGVSRQIVVLGLQWGEGLANVIQPTEGYFMAILAMAGVPLNRWIRFFLPLMGLLVVLALAGIFAAQMVALA
ncbi:YfcC family protein [Craterilacuibacter sinensis]|uniref:YfcC family protein n=1 Tax=Craterilacuibacter sinensis TaxID=2686017 RepID=A0A845BPU6_9NEIS|nr:YfcC family protein [Craterilacuibacter sinensis]MXR36501.1 YfcC family protein [Craterilacuibacter sinensis]